MSLIYALTDKDGDVRYVGKTTKTVKRRLAGHIGTARHGSDLPVSRWIRKHDEQVGIKVLHDLGDVDRATLDEAERYWIRWFRLVQGERLLNVTEGGDGGHGNGGANRGKTWTPEHRAKISASLMGRPAPKSPEHRAKISAARRGLYCGQPAMTAEERRAARNASSQRSRAGRREG